MPQLDKKVRWGVSGCARIAQQSTIPALQRSSNSLLWALASRDQTELAEWQTRFRCPQARFGYGALLTDPDVEAVYIPLPNSLHREWTLKAADQGKHVVCEKPIGLNAAECQEMVAACQSNSVKLMEAFIYRDTDCTRAIVERTLAR